MLQTIRLMPAGLLLIAAFLPFRFAVPDRYAVLENTILTAPFPYIGNGHVATTIFDPYIYVQGIYTGVGSDNRRVAIPSTVQVRIDNNDPAVSSYKLNMEEGYFQTTVSAAGYTVRQKLYCHLRIPEVLVMEITIDRNQLGSLDAISHLVSIVNSTATVGLAFVEETLPDEFNKTQRMFYGITFENQTIYTMSDTVEPFVLLKKNETRQAKVYLTVIATSKDEALQKYIQARKQVTSGVLWSKHVDTWRQRWSEGKVTFQPQTSDTTDHGKQLAQMTYASLYYILSSVPYHPNYSEKFIGLSMQGLASDDDKGRIQWEQETYMYPALLVLHQKAAELLLRSRINKLSAAQRNAEELGLAGAKYPYETGVGGEELFAYNNASVNFSRSMYISGNIAFAIREYVKATGGRTSIPLEQLQNAALQIAHFYQDLIVNGSISGVVSISPPIRVNVTNHAITNVLAELSLRLPKLLQRIPFNGSLSDFAALAELGKSLLYPTFILETTSGLKTEIHAINERPPVAPNENPRDNSTDPDLLLAYLPFRNDAFYSSGLLFNDFKYYKGPSPASTLKQLLRYALFQNPQLAQADADEVLRDEYIRIIQTGREHFGILTKQYAVSSPPENHISLASHGAFLQLILNGYAGLDIRDDRLVVHPQIPVGIATWAVLGVDYQGFSLDFRFTREPKQIRVTVVSSNQADGRVLHLLRRLENTTVTVELNTTVLIDLSGTNWLIGSPTNISRFEIMASVLAESQFVPNPYLFQANTLPSDAGFLPEVGNGHIATAVYNRYVHMNGLYNGQGGASSRAQIPSLVGFKIEVAGKQSFDKSFTLNVMEGIFTEVKEFRNSNGSVEVKREILAHRLNANLLVNRILVQNLSPSSERITVTMKELSRLDLLESDDIQFSKTRNQSISEPTGTTYRVASGKTKIPEIPGGDLLPVTVAWYSSKFPEDLLLEPGKVEEVYLIAAIHADEGVAVRSLEDAIRQPRDALRKSHTDKWASYWNNGRIDVDPGQNFQLAQTLHSSLYYLLSSLPNYEDGNGTFVGLSPGGLAHGAPGLEIDQDYLGHVFWDTEMWMFPPVLFFHPDQARLLISARLRVLETAQKNANVSGYLGAKFPWESAMSGAEVTPWPPAAEYEIHVTGDIAFAARQFLYAAGDKKKAVHDLKLDVLAEQIAEFWQSRMVCNGETCSIDDVMGPDEYHYPVNNSVFTNFVAKLSLEFPEFVREIKEKGPENKTAFMEAAKKIEIRESVHNGKVYHAEFDGFQPDVLHHSSSRNVPSVKQADVILLGYPLDMNMSRELRENDLNIYREITDPRGPAMTWGMFAVGYLELGKKTEADHLFEKYTYNVQKPFGVWSENSDGSGAVNFLTGMGGFLQAVINGYGGFRLRADHLAFDPIELPRTTKWNITGVKYLDHQFNFAFDFVADNIALTVAGRNSTIKLVLETASGSVYGLDAGRTLTYRREKSKIRIYKETSDVFTDPETGATKPPIPTGDATAHISSRILISNLCLLVLFLILCI